MKHPTLAFLAVTLLASSSLVSANNRNDNYANQNDRYDARYDERYDDDRNDYRQDSRYDNRNDRYVAQYGRYDYARVIRVERLGGNGRDYSRQCYDNRGRYSNQYGNQSSINEGAVIGAIAGGAIGNQLANGNSRGAATVTGALIGGLIGQSVDRDNRGGYERHYVECRSDYGYNRGRNNEYRVTYRYRDRVYSTIMPYHPGNNVRVRIDMRPQYDRRFAYRY